MANESLTHNLLAKLSHEFRTPMIGIIGAVELLERENLTSDQLNNVEIIKNSGNTLLTIIDNILDINKLELGQVEINLKPSSLRKIIHTAAIEAASALKAKQLELNMEITDDLNAVALVDELKLKQIISTLLIKAIELAENGNILLKASLSKKPGTENELVISISFNSSFDQSLPNNPLAILNNSSPANEFTAGLSLYFCRQLTQLLGGQLCTTSYSDQSSVFYFSLPLKLVADQQWKETDDASSSFVSSFPFSRYKVLLVEDNNFNIKILSQMLYNYGFEVTMASNGLEGLQKLQEETFDVILMDMQMPVMDGYEASRIISSDPKFNSIPIIAVTANAMIGDREKCLACGCTSYLAKPFQSQELTQEIEKVLKNKLEYKRNILPEKSQQNLLQQGIASLGETIVYLQDAYKTSDWESLISHCQSIKIIAGTLGYKEIHHYASLIESAVREKRIKIIKPALTELKTSYQTIIENKTLIDKVYSST